MEPERGAPAFASARENDTPAVTSVGARLPALDGLRGVAILLVLMAHAFYGVRPMYQPLFPGHYLKLGGGFAGVQLFFVLSGFLITKLLLRDLEQDGKIDFKRFYIRRLRRLYPALIVVCLAFVAMAVAYGMPVELIAIETSRALTYTTNLPWQGVNGFWLAHTWSLAVEEQFYLLWPLCLALCWRGGRRAVVLFCLAAVLLAVFLRTLPLLEEVEYGIVRWDALLIGCLVAIHPYRPGKLLTGLGLLLLVFYAIVPREDYNTIDYLLASLGCAAFLVHALRSNWLANPVLRYFGRISYALYLWHLLLLRPGWPMGLTLLASVLLSELSYRWVEAPMLAGGRRKTLPAAPPAIT